MVDFRKQRASKNIEDRDAMTPKEREKVELEADIAEGYNILKKLEQAQRPNRRGEADAAWKEALKNHNKKIDKMSKGGK